MKAGEVFILDDDKNVRETLRIILGSAGYNVVSFADEEALLKMVRKQPPACILLDIVLPGRSGLEILKDLVEYSVPVIMISGQADISMATKAIRFGARDFIEKPFTREAIISQLAAVLNDRESEEQRKGASEPLPVAFDAREVSRLTRRELEILEHIVRGRSSKEAALALGISHRTVEEYRSKIMLKTGTKNTAELVTAVLRGRNR